VIKSLYIKDFALIDELETTFGEGLNIITGETGAGKSIIIGAFNLLLGERAQLESVREGSRKAIAEAIMDFGDDPELRQLLEDSEVEIRQELILRREIRESGSRAFVNDTPVTLSVLKEIGNHLVDLHGQHDHQLLLNEEHHQKVIDDRASVKPVTKAWREKWQKVSDLRKEKQALLKKERELRDKQELYRFQLKELERLNLEDYDEDAIESEMKLLDGAELLSQNASMILDIGREADANVMDLLNTLQRALQDISRIEPEFELYAQELKTAGISIEEALRFTEQYQTQIKFNPERLESLRQRQAEINRAVKKYTRTLPELISYRDELSQNLNLVDNVEIELEKLDKKLASAEDELRQSAEKLYEVRNREGKELSRQIEQELGRLGFNYAAFEVRVEWSEKPDGWITLNHNGNETAVECRPDGCHDIAFYISTNKGESVKPLAKTASGGEISRIMLALKSILAREQKLPVMIFDEIDTGISGPVALQVGKIMRNLAGHCQILAITHLPQIASMGHSHHVVRKKELEGRTVTRIQTLTQEEHIREVAELMSGSEITEATLSSARELINNSDQN